MAVSVALSALLTVIETLETNVAFANSTLKKITHDGLNQSMTLNSGTTPPAVLVAAYEKAMSAGTATIDLTSLPQSGGLAAGTITAATYKLQALLIKNKAANTGTITVTKGASNGYQLAGATFTMPLKPGQWMLFFGNDLADDVDGTHKTIDISGTGAEILQIVAVFG
jgi:hypothetical protein